MNSNRDDVFGELVWSADGSSCQGTIDFLGARLPFFIESDLGEPTTEDMQKAIAEAKLVFARLDADWEQRVRKTAASEIMHAVYCQSEEEHTADEVDELFADMTLESLDFVYIDDEEHAFPCLRYKAAKCFPDNSLDVQCANDLSVDEVTVNE